MIFIVGSSFLPTILIIMAAKETEKGEDSQSEEGGWTYEFVDVVDKEFECNVCLLPLKDPILTRCGHNMCKTCVAKLLNKTLSI